MQREHVDRQRALRRRSTDAERLVWLHVRGGRLGARFRRQHALGPYIVDFYCAAARLVVEIDGGQHYAPDAIAHDARRSAWLESMGLRVARFTNRDVLLRPTDVLEALRALVSGP